MRDNDPMFIPSSAIDPYLLKMRAQTFHLLFSLAVIAVAVAIPVERDENRDTNSVGQHLARAGLWVMGIATVLTLGVGTITYGTNWLHRFQVIKAEHEGSKTVWDAAQDRKDKQHQKNMEALDILLDVARNYTDNIGKERKEFDPLAIVDQLENDMDDARIINIQDDNILMDK